MWFTEWSVKNLARAVALVIVGGLVLATWTAGNCAFRRDTSAERNDAKPPTGCLATANEYASRFPAFKNQLKDQKAKVSGWTAFRKNMEEKQNRSAARELCVPEQLESMKKIVQEIPVTLACSGEIDAPVSSKAANSAGDIAQLESFRDCSETKARQLGDTIRQRRELRPGEETAQLHQMIKEITKVNNDSIELLVEFREAISEARTTRCWLLGRIHDCGR